jgi:hypothetical protein
MELSVEGGKHVGCAKNHINIARETDRGLAFTHSSQTPDCTIHVCRKRRCRQL